MFEKNTEVTGTSSHRAKHSNVSIYYSLGCKQGKAITAEKKKKGMLQQGQHSVCCTEKQSIESQELDKLIICYYHSIDQRPNKFQGLIKVDLYTQLVESQYLTLRACNLIKGLLWESLSVGGWKTTNGYVGANRDSLSAQLDVDSTFSKQPWVRQTVLAWGLSSLWARKRPEWWNAGSENEVKNRMDFVNLL